MKLDKVTLSLYKYKIKSCILYIGSGKKRLKYELDEEMIQEMEIINDYEGSFFPFFTMTFMLPNNAYRTLTKNENTDKVSMKLQFQRGRFTDAYHIDPDTNHNFKDAISGTYHVVIGPKEQEIHEEAQEEAEENGNEYGQMSRITVALYNKQYFDNYDIVVNAILRDVNPMDIMVYCLNKAKIDTMLVSPPSNTKKYEEFRLVPIPLYKQLTRLCDTYAFHKKGSIVYFDLTRGYVIEKDPSCTAYEQGENKLTYLVVSTKSAPTNYVGGGYENTEKHYYLLNAQNLTTDNSSDVKKKISGNNIVTIDKDGKVTKTNKKATKVSNVVIQKEGENTAKAIKRSIKETKNVVSIQMSDIDIMALSPNKQFVLTVEGSRYKNYNGKYRLKHCSHIFTRDGNYFSVKSVALLTK